MRLLKQRNLPWLGALMDSIFTTLPILSPLSYVTMIAIFYATVREYLVGWIPWMTFSWFVGILILLGLTLMAGVYLLVLPSIWNFRKKQMALLETESLREIKILQEEVHELRKEIKGLREEKA